MLYPSAEEWIEDNTSRKLKDFTGVSGITTEYNNPQSVSKITELIVWLAKIKITGHRH